MIYITRPKNKLVITILIKRTASFLFGLCILTIFLYGIGTYQEFMDITQTNLLSLAIILGILLGIISFFGFVLAIILFFRKQFHYLKGAGSYILLGFFGILVAALGTFILVLTRGNST